MSTEWRRDKFLISTDRSRLDRELLNDFLSREAYWAIGRSAETIARSIENSFCFGLYLNDEQGERQIGFARVVTDFATFAWLADVFVLPGQRGQGLAQWLLATIFTHPELQGFRRWLLATKDAHELYRRYGFSELAEPGRWLERFNPGPINHS
jgi:GNAT superfamily N-acetyltransferase